MYHQCISSNVKPSIIPENYREMLDGVHYIIDRYSPSHKIILCGDLNGSLLQSRSNPHDGMLKEFVQEHVYFSWFGPELFCLLLGPPGFNCWSSSAPVFQWCCSTPQGSPGVGRNTFLSSPHLCFIIVFICDLFVSRDDQLMS